jgi:hypothetical protein
MFRIAFIAAFVFAIAAFGDDAFGHDNQGGPHGDAQYYALFDDFHANPSTTDATGEIFLHLNDDQTELAYTIVLGDGLELKPNAADRTGPDDIIGIHLHLHVPDTVGPHVLNIFGLATFNVPAEEDSDVVIDYEHRTVSGVWDNGDATIDPNTGQPYPQFFPLTSKLLADWIDDLNEGMLMVAVHTNESGFPTMAIHGHISRLVPEPSTSVLMAAGLFSMAARRRSWALR